MSARLQYDISVLGADRFKRVMRGVGAELKALDRQAGAVARSARSSAAKVTRVSGGAARGAAGVGPFSEIAKAARLQQAEEMRRHRLAFRNRQKEKASAISGIAEIGRVAAREEARIHRKRLSDAAKESRARSAAVRGAAKSFGRGTAGTLRNAGRNIVGLGGTALGAVGIVGGIATGAAVADEIEVRKRASQLANQAGTPEIKDELAKEARGVVGFSGTEALGGLEAFVDLTGNLGAAVDLLPDLGKLALATGTDLAELAATAGNAFIPISDQIKKPTERLEKMREVMAALAGQGQIGAVEIKDFAKEFAGLAAVSNIFGGDTTKNLKLMGAFAQATRQRGGAQSAAEAVTSVVKFGADVTKTRGQKALSKLGINVFSDKEKTQLKDPRQIIQDVLAQTGGDLTKVNKIFGERGIRTLRGFAPLYTQAERKKKGSGRAAVDAEFERLMGAQLSTDDVDKRFESRKQDADVQLAEASKKFNEAVGTKLLPVITSLIPKLSEMIPPFADLASAVAELIPKIMDDMLPVFKEVAPVILDSIKTLTDTFGGVGGIVAAVLVKEIAMAGISSLVSGAVSGVATKVASSVLGAGAASTAAGAATGAATSGAAAGAAGGGVLAGAGALLAKAGTGMTGALGVAGATAAAGGAAVAGIGAAIYQGFKLFQETNGFSDFSTDVAGGASGAEYDKFMREAGLAPPEADKEVAAQHKTASDKQMEAADKQLAAAERLAALGTGVSPRRTDPIHIR